MGLPSCVVVINDKYIFGFCPHVWHGNEALEIPEMKATKVSIVVLTSDFEGGG